MSDTPALTPFVWNTSNLKAATLGTWQHLNDQTERTLTSTCICTDTRKIKQGDVFLAIKGDNFDGHTYLEKAKALGAVAAIVSDVQTTAALQHFPQLQVADTKLALGNLGRFVRAAHSDLNVVALTGSSGKTTTKEMLGNILNQYAPTLVTRGNLNNDLGVPMMLLELTEEQKYAVLELGANHLGEIAYTTEMVQPDVACVLNIGTAHLGEFGGRDNICNAKSEIFAGLSAEKFAVIPQHDDYADALKQNASAFTQKITVFGQDIIAENVVTTALGSTFTLVFNELTENNTHTVKLPFAGGHNVQNALAAAACAYNLGIAPQDIANGLTHAVAPKGRLNHISFNQHTFIDDTYNANPDATLAAADVLVQTADEHNENVKCMLILGDIGELGDAAVSEHQKLGAILAEKNIDALYAVGDLMAHCVASAKENGLSATHFASKDALTQALQQQMAENTVVALFKGSRFMAIETIIKDITT